MKHYNTKWIDFLIAAARHSPQAVDFVLDQFNKSRESGLAYSEVTDMQHAIDLYSIIVNEGLSYEIRFQCTPETVQFSSVLGMLNTTCPRWRLSPRCEFYNNGAMVKADGQIDCMSLIEHTNEQKTLGGFSYQRIIVCVNQAAAAMLKIYLDDVYVRDYSDLVPEKCPITL